MRVYNHWAEHGGNVIHVGSLSLSSSSSSSLRRLSSPLFFSVFVFFLALSLFPLSLLLCFGCLFFLFSPRFCVVSFYFLLCSRMLDLCRIVSSNFSFFCSLLFLFIFLFFFSLLALPILLLRSLFLVRREFIFSSPILPFPFSLLHYWLVTCSSPLSFPPSCPFLFLAPYS